LIVQRVQQVHEIGDFGPAGAHNLEQNKEFNLLKGFILNQTTNKHYLSSYLKVKLYTSYEIQQDYLKVHLKVFY